MICAMSKPLSIRRACQLVGLNRATWRYRLKPDPNQALRSRIRELAARYPYYGSPMLYSLLRNEGRLVNHKRVERIYRLEKLSLRLKRSRKKLRHLREALPVPEARDDVW